MPEPFLPVPAVFENRKGSLGNEKKRRGKGRERAVEFLAFSFAREDADRINKGEERESVENVEAPGKRAFPRIERIGQRKTRDGT